MNYLQSWKRFVLSTLRISRLRKQRRARPWPDLDTLLVPVMNLAAPPINVIERMRTAENTTPALMTERTSPSKGAIETSTIAAHEALAYALSGACVALGHRRIRLVQRLPPHMRLVRQAVVDLSNRPAIHCKDFTVDEYQVTDVRLQGVDTVLLIVALLPTHRLQTLCAIARSLSMELLVEVNNTANMENARTRRCAHRRDQSQPAQLRSQHGHDERRVSARYSVARRSCS